jgi:hypothetical protein
MSFLLYSADPPSHIGVSADHRHLHPLTLHSLGEAIDAATALILKGAVVWKIAGSDGFTMERRDIEIECQRRAREPLSQRAIVGAALVSVR